MYVRRTYVRTYIRMYVRMYVCTYVCMYVLDIHIRTIQIYPVFVSTSFRGLRSRTGPGEGAPLRAGKNGSGNKNTNTWEH